MLARGPRNLVLARGPRNLVLARGPRNLVLARGSRNLVLARGRARNPAAEPRWVCCDAGGAPAGAPVLMGSILSG